jgi:surface antigen
MRYLSSVRRAALTGRTSFIAGLMLTLALAVLLVPARGTATIGVDDYPSNLKSAAQDSRVDPWNFYNRECTSFVAWRLNHDVGIAFHNWYQGHHWGDAAIWKRAALDSGVPVDNVARRGAIAWWAQGSPGSSSGHVAWVTAVTSSSITVEEYNYVSRGRYDQRTIATTSSKWPTAFIHLGKATMTNTARPTVAGTPRVGVKLTASPGTWSPSGATYAYQWYAGGAMVSGATGRTFTPLAAQLGKQIRVKVTASLADATSASTTSVLTPAVAPGLLTASAPPVVSGSPQVGVQLAATSGTWSPRATLAYQWLAAGTPIAGATRSVLTPTAEQLGAPLTVKVTATRLGYATATATTAATTGVQPGVFAAVSPPTVTGTPQVDQPLTASPGEWSPSAEPAYQWLVDGAPVAGATGPSYTPAVADLRKQVAVQVTVARPGYTSTSATSAATDAVIPGTFQNTSDPVVSGTARVGVPLRATPGGWSPEPAFGYQWSADGSPIAGATSSTFIPTPAQAGRTLTVQVTARRAGYLTAVVDSPATAKVLPGANSVVTVPAVSGQPIVGRTLTASSGTWAVPPTTVAYQWYADGVAIPGATASTFTLTPDQLDRRIRVSVSATADGYEPKAASSAATGPVVNGQAAFTTAPVITGRSRVGGVLTAGRGTFTPSTATATYQWLRSGVPIRGATARSYLLRPVDVGHRVTVAVTLTAPHWAPTTARAGSGRLVKAVPQLTVRTSAHDTWAGVSVRVVTPGLPGPDGKVRVLEGDTSRGTAAITDGRGYLRLNHLSRGTHHLVLRYRGPGPQVSAFLRFAVTIG